MMGNKKTFKMISGALFIAAGLLRLVVTYIQYNTYLSSLRWYYDEEPVSFLEYCSLSTLVYVIAVIALGVLIIISKSNKANIGIVIAAGIIAVIGLLSWTDCLDGYFYIFDVYCFFSFVGFAALFAVALISCLDKLSSQLGFLAIIPAVLLGISALLCLIINIRRETGWSVILLLTLLLLYVAAAVLFGLWLYPYKSTAAQSGKPHSAVGSAEQLTELKALLDMGALTQEEFDAKKREILGL